MTFLIVLTIAPVAQAQDITTGLVGHWKLDETSGTVAADSTGNGHDGDLVDDPEWEPDEGVLGGALNFPGPNSSSSSGSRVNIPHDPALSPANITVAVWVRPNIQATQSLINKGQLAPGWELSLSSSGPVFFRINKGHSNDVRVESYSSYTYPSSGTEWVHVVGTYDGNEMVLYINGERNRSESTSVAIETNSSKVALGTRNDNTRGFIGDLDDVRIYDRALSAVDVAALYSFGLGMVRYNETYHVPEYYNGTDWVAMAVVTAGGGGAGCDTPNGDEGQIFYNSTHHVMQYCNGDRWVPMGPLAAGGAGCVDPAGSAGDMIYNPVFRVVQYCNSERWVVPGGRFDPCDNVTAPPVGTQCVDGSYYIGPSPKDGKWVFMTGLAYEGTNISWDEDPPCFRCGEGDTSATSSTDGRANVEALRAYGGDNATAGTLDGFAAAKYCDGLNAIKAHGRDDWYLPAGDNSSEMNLIWFMVQAVGSSVGGLNVSGSRYWTSRETNDYAARLHRFNDGEVVSHDKNLTYRVRCVRR